MPNTHPDPQIEHLFTVDDLARAWRKTNQFIRREIHAGRLRAHRLGPELRIRQEDVMAYLDAHVSDGPAACRDPLRYRRKTPVNRPRDAVAKTRPATPRGCD